LPLREDMTPNPLSPYALQKWECERYSHLFYRLYGTPSVVLRYFNVFGDRMATEGQYATVIGAFIRETRLGCPLVVYGDGEQTRDFTHISDIVRGNILAMRAGSEVDGRTINLGTGESVSVNCIAARFGGPILYKPKREGEPRHTLADNSEALRLLGWKPEVPFDLGLNRLLDKLQGSNMIRSRSV
jgi:UDP-glucose 4-epimerase